MPTEERSLTMEINGVEYRLVARHDEVASDWLTDQIELHADGSWLHVEPHSGYPTAETAIAEAIAEIVRVQLRVPTR